MGAAVLLMCPCPSRLPRVFWLSGGSLRGFSRVTEPDQTHVMRSGKACSPPLHQEPSVDDWLLAICSAHLSAVCSGQRVSCNAGQRQNGIVKTVNTPYIKHEPNTWQLGSDLHLKAKYLYKYIFERDSKFRPLAVLSYQGASGLELIQALDDMPSMSF